LFKQNHLVGLTESFRNLSIAADGKDGAGSATPTIIIDRWPTYIRA
jgi:hypothetical protein